MKCRIVALSARLGQALLWRASAPSPRRSRYRCSPWRAPSELAPVCPEAAAPGPKSPKPASRARHEVIRRGQPPLAPRSRQRAVLTASMKTVRRPGLPARGRCASRDTAHGSLPMVGRRRDDGRGRGSVRRPEPSGTWAFGRARIFGRRGAACLFRRVRCRRPRGQPEACWGASTSIAVRSTDADDDRRSRHRPRCRPNTRTQRPARPSKLRRPQQRRRPG
jgi:hypothetical protein